MSYQEPPFRIQRRLVGDHCLITVFGEVDMASSRELGRALEEALSSAAAIVTLDLAAVTFLDSAGIRILMKAVSASRAGANTLSVRPEYTSQVRRLLELTGVIDGLPYLADAPATDRV